MPKVLVCMKPVAPSDAKIKIDGGKLDDSVFTPETNPYDEFAGEEAIRLVEKLGGSNAVLTLGPDSAEKAIKDMLARGVQEAYRVWGDEFAGGDVLSTATALAAAAQKVGFDLVLCGKQAIDQDNHAFGPYLAELLGVPHVTAVSTLEINEGGTCKATREIEGGTEVIEFSLPAVVSTDKGLNEPRFASMKGIMAVKKKTITVWGTADLGLSASQVGSAGAGSTVLSEAYPPARSAGKIVGGADAAAQARELARLLREEAKVL